MEKKHKKFMWKYVGYFFILLACLFGIVFLINLLIITKAPFKVAQNNDWIGFWGNILGSILSGIITFIVLRVTILNDQNKRKQDKKMELYPYLSYRSLETVDFIKIDDEYKEKNNIMGEIISFMPLATKKDLQKLKDGEALDIHTQIVIMVKNVGLGIAIGPKLVNMSYFGDDILPEGDSVTDIIAIGEIAIINLNVILPQKVLEEDSIFEVILTIGYFNILKDYYEQDVKVMISKTIKIEYDDEGKFRKTSVVYGRNIIKEISEPKIVRYGGYNG